MQRVIQVHKTFVLRCNQNNAYNPVQWKAEKRQTAYTCHYIL